MASLPLVVAIGITPRGDDAGAERDGQAGHGATDGAEADDADGDLAQLARRQRLPGPLSLQLQQLWQPTHDGEDHHQGVLGDGFAEDTACVGDEQAALRGLRREDTLHSGRRRMDPAPDWDSAPAAGRTWPRAWGLAAGPRRRRAGCPRGPRARRRRGERQGPRRGCARGPLRGSEPRGSASARWRRVRVPARVASVMHSPLVRVSAGDDTAYPRRRIVHLAISRQCLRSVPKVGDGGRSTGRMHAGHEALAAAVLLELDVHARQPRHDAVDGRGDADRDVASKRRRIRARRRAAPPRRPRP